MARRPNVIASGSRGGRGFGGYCSRSLDRGADLFGPWGLARLADLSAANLASDSAQCRALSDRLKLAVFQLLSRFPESWGQFRFCAIACGAPGQSDRVQVVAMRIAYLINQYPEVSHTFIRREILALERQGFEIMRISLRGWDAELVDRGGPGRAQADALCARAGKLSRSGSAPADAPDAPDRVLARPSRSHGAWAGAPTPLPVHLVYLAEACRIAFWLKAADVRARARAFRHQLGRGGDAGSCARRAALELHRSRPGGIRQAATHRPCGKDPPLLHLWSR